MARRKASLSLKYRKGSKIDPKERKHGKAQTFRLASSRGLMERTYTRLLALCNR